jgi:hypothetical protein
LVTFYRERRLDKLGRLLLLSLILDVDDKRCDDIASSVRCTASAYLKATLWDQQKISQIICTRTKACNARVRLQAPRSVAVLERAHSVVKHAENCEHCDRNPRGMSRTKTPTCSWFSAAKLASNVLL